MKKKRKTSIQAKTLIYLLVFNVVIILLLWICQAWIFDFYYEKEQISNMDNIVASIKDANENELDSLLQDISYQNEVCILVIDDYGKYSSYNTNMKGCALKNENTKVQELMVNFINADADFKAYQFVNDDKQVAALLYGLKNNNQYTFLYSNLEDISDFTLIIKQQLMYVCFLGIFVAVIISIFLSTKLTDPIAEITKKAKKLGNGNYNVEFKESGIKEIDELAQTLTQAQKEMAKTDELRRDLMANVSHDLKTPLTMIKAYAEMIKDISYKDRKKMNEHLDIIHNDLHFDNIFYKDGKIKIIDFERSMYAPKDFELDILYRMIRKPWKFASEETEQYTFNVEMPEEIWIKADKKKINQVIYNLINNAINYTGDDKQVTIRVTKQKRSYLVEIIDTGKGIKEEEIPYIWDKYYKSDKKHQRNVVSTGLGLSIVKQILELHDFEYGVKSVLKKGSTFYFKIKI